jgi:hypothetical protein
MTLATYLAGFGARVGVRGQRRSPRLCQQSTWHEMRYPGHRPDEAYHPKGFPWRWRDEAYHPKGFPWRWRDEAGPRKIPRSS